MSSSEKYFVEVFKIGIAHNFDTCDNTLCVDLDTPSGKVYVFWIFFPDSGIRHTENVTAQEVSENDYVQVCI